MYIESKYLADNKEKTVKKETKSSSSSSTSSKSNSSSSSSSGSSNKSSVDRGNIQELNEYRWVEVNGSLTRGAKILTYDKDSNGWSKIKNGSNKYKDGWVYVLTPARGYMSSRNLK